MISQLVKKAETWSTRFNEPASDLVERCIASVSFGKRLMLFDIQGSLAHAVVLVRQGIIAGTNHTAIEQDMAQIRQEIEADTLEWRLGLEDVHLSIEVRLTAMVGDAGKRLYTGRSCSDQVVADTRLRLRGEIDNIVGLLKALRGALLDLVGQYTNTIVPGFIHLQVTQSVVFGHHLLIYTEMFIRSTERMLGARRRVNRLPLDAAALTGTNYPVDRELVIQQLGFEGIYRNSLDATSDCDLAIELYAAATLTMTHVSRFSEELALWMSPCVGFIDTADRFCTGSSIMPQKKNPDVPELARDKTGRVNSHPIGLFTPMKGQPLAHNKDNQEDKEPLFDTVDMVVDMLYIFAGTVPGITVKADAMRAAALQGYVTATDLTGYLVKRGLPFRDTYGAAAYAVCAYGDLRCGLASLSIAQLRDICGLGNKANLISDDVHTVLTLEGSVVSHNHIDGAALEQVKQVIAFVRAALAEQFAAAPNKNAALINSARRFCLYD